jgi:hypothetical protein
MARPSRRHLDSHPRAGPGFESIASSPFASSREVAQDPQPEVLATVLFSFRRARVEPTSIIDDLQHGPSVPSPRANAGVSRLSVRDDVAQRLLRGAVEQWLSVRRKPQARSNLNLNLEAVRGQRGD